MRKQKRNVKDLDEITLEYNVHYREKNKGWQLIISYKNADGNWKQKSKQGFESKPDAKEALFPLLKQIEEQLKFSLNPTKITFGEFAEKFIQKTGKNKAFSTSIVYGSALNSFSALNEKQLTRITCGDIQDIVDSLEVMDSTLRTYVACINVLFNRAIKTYRLRIDNPCEYVERRHTEKRPKKIKALTNEEFESLFDIFTEQKSQIFILLAGTCGLRCAEAIGLTWDDIDFDNNLINVNKQWKYNGEKYDFGQLKTSNSYRTIPLPPRTKRALLEYQKDWVPVENNRILPYSSALYVDAMFRTRLSNKRIKLTPHDLRHTYATALIKSGLDFKSSAKLLGHDVSMTLSTYSHVTAEMDENSASVVNDIFK